MFGSNEEKEKAKEVDDMGGLLGDAADIENQGREEKNEFPEELQIVPEQSDSETLIRISLCGGAFQERQPHTWEQMADIFDEFAVSFDMLSEMPGHIMQNENLIV